MDDSLKSELEQLLRKYPELKNSKVSFTDSAFDIKAQGDDTVPGDTTISICERVGQFPDIITGPSQKIEVRRSAVHGYGVFAKEDIAAGELIEQSKLLKLGWRRQYIKDPVLNDYIWANKDCECNECKTHGHYVYVALGFGSLYNHADTPNTVKKNDHAAQIITITAARDIKKDEEIFITYGNKYFMVRNFWKKVKANNSFEKFLEGQDEDKQQ